MLNIDEEIVDKLLEDIPNWLQLLRNKGITPFEKTLVSKIRQEAETLLKDYERKNQVT